VPRAIAIDDDRKRPSARRGKRKEERGLLLRLFLRNPRDIIAGSAAVIAVLAIIINALFLQAGRHPSPIFGSTVTLPPTSTPPKIAAVATEAANPLPRPRPSEADAPIAEPSKSDDAVGNLVRATSQPVGNSSRVAAVQRALSEYGYGQIKPTGTIGADTQAAIQRFERERKMPITGQMSDRLVRELALAIGKPIQ
jgi:hypothetical protein